MREGLADTAHHRTSRRTASAARGLLLVTALTAGAAAPATGQTWHDFRSARQVQGVEALDIQLLYGAGRLTVSPSELGFLYDARLRYDADKLEAVRDWRREDDSGRLRLSISSIPDPTDDSRARIRLDDWDVEFDFDDLPRGDEKAADLTLLVNPSVPTDLDLGIGAGRARLEMGGMTLTSLEFSTGASDARISFDTPNRTRMRKLTIRSGAAEFVAEHLGNARFDAMEMSGFVGDVLLDFSGEWTASAEAEIRMALGGLVMRVPRDIGVRIERSGLASMTADDFEKVGDAYLSPNWASAPVRLELRVTAGIGTVKVERS